jgi:murein DD-endopeptidase MepM/ murein hydrolase activator NlpD
MRRTWLAAAFVVGAAFATAPAPARAEGNPSTAALQVALRARSVYSGTVDGMLGPRTRAAVVKFQRRAGLVPDGIPGPRTRRALGGLGRPPLGSRLLRRRSRGWDVAALQFVLAWHGFPPGPFDGVFGAHTIRAVRLFQRFAGLAPDGVAGAATMRALPRPPPPCRLRLTMPVSGLVVSPFGPRGGAFHAGIDIAAQTGVPVRAAATGTVVFAGWNDGFGNLVVVAHGLGVETYYAHLSRISVRPGEAARRAAVVGRVGATGDATGPHLHLEVHVRGAAIDPLPALHAY